MRLLVFDLFAGTGSSTAAFADAGDDVVRFEMGARFGAEVQADVEDLDAATLLEQWGRPDYVWASPPCTKFSVARIGTNWENVRGKLVPRNPETHAALRLVEHTVRLVAGLAPRRGWLMENPVAALRKTETVRGLPRQTVTYCQYGDTRMKPTDLFGSVEGWTARPQCAQGATCHESAPRGARTGTQGLKNAEERGRVPYDLGAEIRAAIVSAQEATT